MQGKKSLISKEQVISTLQRLATELGRTPTREELEQRSSDVFNMIIAGKLKLRISHVYKLEEVQHAHRDLEARKTTGKILLVP